MTTTPVLCGLVMIQRRRRRLLTGAASAAVLVVLAAVVYILVFAAGPPTVTFASALGSVHTGPAQYCDLKVTRCANHPDAVVHLAVPAGARLEVTVPHEVAAAPWQVAFSYQPKDGPRADARGPVFAPNTQNSYTLRLPEPSDQLVTAQVQQYGGAAPTVDANGDPTFPIRASWVLNVP